MAEPAFTISNPDESHLASEVLRGIARSVDSESPNSTSVTSRPDEETKGTLVLELALAVAAAAAWDAIKYVVARMRQRPDYDGSVRLVIDGHSYTLRELEPDFEAK